MNGQATLFPTTKMYGYYNAKLQKSIIKVVHTAYIFMSKSFEVTLCEKQRKCEFFFTENVMNSLQKLYGLQKWHINTTDSKHRLGLGI